MVAGSKQSKPNGGSEWTLSSILDNPDAFESEMTNGDDVMGEEPVEESKGAEEGYCIECEDQPANTHCETCADDFCEVCFEAQHRKGTRKLHKFRPLESFQPVTTATPAQQDVEAETEETNVDEPNEELDADQPIAESSTAAPKSFLSKRAKSIPLRLTLQERKLLRLLESALHVSEYTDRVDILSYSSTRTKRAAAQIRELCAILSGLCLAADYKTGQELFEGRDFAANEDWFARVFEIGRRHKVMNPDKMRETYGKLIYLLMDAQSHDVSDLLGFSPVVPLVTVYSTLEDHGALAVLEDPRLEVATKEIISPPGASGRVRAEVQRNIRAKERAVEALVNDYAGTEASSRALRSSRRAAQKEEESDGLEKKASQENDKKPISAELLRQCIYSISDNSAFLRVNRDPCEIMIGYLKKYFHPTKCTPTKTLEEVAKVEQPSLAIRNGRNGARLSHDHSKQYAYVLQSLTLWREILGDMFHLWTLAESDLLSTTASYRLKDTGQGLNRVQHAPKTSREMHAILGRAQRDLGSWVGSSVIHMGDHNVPNALLFIDKYSQVYRILLPITNILSHISNDPRVRDYAIREFGGVEEATRIVLVDFFRSAFDGSGADSYFDAGSCIDGRLTSAWNWCSLLEKKSYFPLFLLSGFIGFDGQW
ncbi:putative adenylosuccinate lyase [Rhizoctonia solani 123E]|uniref:Putative adenylosuccinate lyase n=1 Tax=Rhizoctonia solani 123E TaxID=1423351 RepID=A0A074RYQ3_9AGAM|nr:putative adenylosuccinate lyase [Rhizoctonia solani 123E]